MPERSKCRAQVALVPTTDLPLVAGEGEHGLDRHAASPVTQAIERGVLDGGSESSSEPLMAVKGRPSGMEGDDDGEQSGLFVGGLPLQRESP